MRIDPIKAIANLPINYDESLSKQYIALRDKIEIDGYINYQRDKTKYKGFFQFGISVQINENSEFIPFFLFKHPDLVELEKKKKEITPLVPNQVIKYNYTEFYQDVCELFQTSSGDISEFFFSVKFDNSAQRYLISEFWIDKDDTNQPSEEISDPMLLVKINNLLYDNNKTDFVQQLGAIYNKTALYFMIVAFDEDIESRKKLTHFIGLAENKDELEEFMAKNVRKCRNLVSLIRTRYAMDLYKKNIREATKSAKAAIMSRNMSHNLGSHVMFYIKQRLESVEKIMETGTLQELVKSQSIKELKKKIESKIALGEYIEMPFLVGLGRFLNYLQERQDFIATVATNYIPYSTTINFKDAIYDELKPDKRAERHSNDQDTKGKKAANLLLDYIAMSEGFAQSDNISLRFGNDDGTFFDGSGAPEDVPTTLREFNISVPGGNLGRQAFFSIMENIIRNTAKHDGSKAQDGKLLFQFDILKPERIDAIKGYSYRQGDTKDQQLDTDCYENFKNDYYYLGISVLLKGKVADNTLDKICDGLRRKYVTESGQMDENCKGLKEIRISAAWLRGEELDNMIPGNEPPAVAVRKNENGDLQYIICLPRPKRVAFVSLVEKTAQGQDFDSMLDENGCQQFKMPFAEKKKLKTIADFGLIVCSKEDYEKIGPYVGARICKTDVVSTMVEQYELAKKEYPDWKKAYDDLRNSELDSSLSPEEFKKECEAMKLKNPVEKFISDLYLLWLGQEFEVGPNVKISVLDHKVSKDVENILNDGLIVVGTSDDTEKKYYEDKVIFNTHYQGQANISVNQDLFAQAYYVEAVSGGNSTDRLIRHDKRDVAWYCGLMSAGLSQVAIFDERLYSQIMPQEEFNLIEAENCFDKNYSGKDNLSLLIEVTEDKFKLDEKNKKEGTILYDSLIDLNDKNAIREAYISKLFHFKKIRNYAKTWQYREKGVWAFNLRLNPGHPIDIIGYKKAPNGGQIGFYDLYDSETVIGHICFEEGMPTIKLLETPFEKQFDFISIHQGLLDKIYGNFGIHEDSEKEALTKEIFDKFSKSAGLEILINQDSIANQSEKKYFLPKFIIHSGRSKPNHKDMPQHLPFLQFSAIDHAVRDCKHTLTELLYSAHYEQED